MKKWLSIAAFALVPAGAAGEDLSTHHTYAKPIVRTAPKYPSSELRRGRQGWVELNYVITEDGDVVEPVVEASSGSPAFERAAISTVKRWRYEPAMIDGEPIQQCKTAVRISFAIDGSQTGVSRRFHNTYSRIEKALEEGDLEFAEAKVSSAFESDGLTLGELSWLWVLRARIAGMRGDRDDQLAAVRRALSVSGGWIPGKLRTGLLKTRFVLEVEKGDYASAMATYAALKLEDGTDTSALDPFAEQLAAIVDSEQLLSSPAEIGGASACETCDSRWEYKPLRRAVEITDVDGELGNLEFRCEWQRYVDKAREGVAWKIPASWGKCSMIVHGETGTTFTLVELPAS